MAGARAGHGGGIFSLCDLVAEFPGAVEYDLIRHGVRLRDVGSERFSWRDFWVVMRWMPPEGSAMWREREPEDSPWTHQLMLLAEQIDLLSLLVWAKTKDGSRNRNRPKPYPRPGARPKKFGKKPLPLDEMKEWLGWDASPTPTAEQFDFTPTMRPRDERGRFVKTTQ